jgi:hypothetical protein
MTMPSSTRKEVTELLGDWSGGDQGNPRQKHEYTHKSTICDAALKQVAETLSRKTRRFSTLTVREEQRNKLEQMASLEKRSVSNLIEVMADERWEKLSEREGVDYAKVVAEIAGLKGLRADKEADRKVFRREVLERVLKYKKR